MDPPLNQITSQLASEIIWDGDVEEFTTNKTFPMEGISGPTNAITDNHTELDIFERFFDNTLIQHLVDEINKSGRGSDRLWKSVTIPEFKKFIASLLFSGICQLPFLG
jgi:hypothetical protein